MCDMQTLLVEEGPDNTCQSRRSTGQGRGHLVPGVAAHTAAKAGAVGLRLHARDAAVVSRRRSSVVAHLWRVDG